MECYLQSNKSDRIQMCKCISYHCCVSFTVVAKTKMIPGQLLILSTKEDTLHPLKEAAKFCVPSAICHLCCSSSFKNFWWLIFIFRMNTNFIGKVFDDLSICNFNTNICKNSPWYWPFISHIRTNISSGNFHKIKNVSE